MQVLLTPWKRSEKEAILRSWALRVKETFTFKGIKILFVISSLLLNLLSVAFDKKCCRSLIKMYVFSWGGM